MMVSRGPAAAGPLAVDGAPAPAAAGTNRNATAVIPAAMMAIRTMKAISFRLLARMNPSS
jgi:hypothetical protein